MSCQRSSISLKCFILQVDLQSSELQRPIIPKLIFSNDSMKLITRMSKSDVRIKRFSHTLAKILAKQFQTFKKFFLTSTFMFNLTFMKTWHLKTIQYFCGSLSLEPKTRVNLQFEFFNAKISTNKLNANSFNVFPYFKMINSPTGPSLKNIFFSYSARMIR